MERKKSQLGSPPRSKCISTQSALAWLTSCFFRFLSRPAKQSSHKPIASSIDNSDKSEGSGHKSPKIKIHFLPYSLYTPSQSIAVINHDMSGVPRYLVSKNFLTHAWRQTGMISGQFFKQPYPKLSLILNFPGAPRPYHSYSKYLTPISKQSASTDQSLVVPTLLMHGLTDAFPLPPLSLMQREGIPLVWTCGLKIQDEFKVTIFCLVNIIDRQTGIVQKDV